MARTSNYSYVVDSTFDPFSFGELVQPLEVYKEAYKEAEDKYIDLADKSNAFKYLSETLPEGSKARAIYEGYAGELDKQAKDLSKNGLNMGNRRALTNLKSRYQGEIGRLMKADKALEEEKALRRQVNLKDSSMLYANDNLDIDQFLDGNTPNLYSISGTELYTRGAAAGKAVSSRVYQAGDAGSTLGGYYRKWVERYGYGKESMDAFRANASAIPELQQAAEAIAVERGVYDNLTGINRERARQSILNGIIDGAVYQEKVNPVRDAGVMSASERDASARGWAAQRIAQEKWEREKEEDDIRRKLLYKTDDEGNIIGLNDNYVKDNYTVDPLSGKMKKSSSALTAEEAATRAVQKKELMEQMQNAKNLKSAKTLKDIEKAGFVPISATVHPSHGSSKGLSVIDAAQQKKYDNVEGWRSGPQGTDVPDLYIDWTNAPLVEGSQHALPDLVQWSSGSSSKPNNGDFSYNIAGAQTKILSDVEYSNLPPAVQLSLEGELSRQGYPEDTYFEVMQVTGRKGKTSYMTLVPKDKQILLGD